MATLQQDATNRSARSFLQGLAIDVLVGIALVLGTFFLDKNSWGEIEWTILSFSVFKSFVQALAAYVMRAFLDGSSLPTPLPPASVPAPNESVEVVRDDLGQSPFYLVLFVVVVVVVVLLLTGLR